MRSPLSPRVPRARVPRASLLPLTALTCATVVALSSVAAFAQRRPPRPGFEHLPVAGNVHLFAGTGANVVVQAGDEGLVFVDTSRADASDRLLAEARGLTNKPIRYVIDTNGDADHIGGNEVISNAGLNFATPPPNQVGVGGGVRGAGGPGRTAGAQVYAHEATLNRMSTQGSPVPFGLWPTDTFFTMKKTLYFNGEPIELLHQPAAHTDGDVIVWFRKSDVVAAGDVYTPDRFPWFDLDRGGSLQGLIDALNRIVDITVPRFNQQGGTLVVPGHGRIGNESDVVEYRDMATIIRDRFQAMVAKRMTLEQVKAAKPLLDYDGIYGATNGPWTTDQFIEAVYRDLSRPTPATRPAAR